MKTLTVRIYQSLICTCPEPATPLPDAPEISSTSESNRRFKDSQSVCLQCRRPGFDSWVGKFPWRRDGLPTPVFLGFSGGSDSKESPPATRETWVPSVGWEDPLDGVWQSTPAFLPGESPWTEEAGGLQSVQSQKSRTRLSNWAQPRHTTAQARHAL